jgi:hypothetical protein
MKRALFVVSFALALCGAASAQAPKAATIAARAPTTPVPFGCDARAPDVCYFRIFYTRGDRIVILPAGMKEKKVPATVGGGYCMTLNKAPVHKCTRKVINDKYNS